MNGRPRLHVRLRRCAAYGMSLCFQCARRGLEVAQIVWHGRGSRSSSRPLTEADAAREREAPPAVELAVL